MAGTYSQIYLHVVFAVKYRHGLLAASWRPRLLQYLNATIQEEHHKPLCLNGVADHVHLAIGIRPAQSVSELVQRIKQASSRWINDERLTVGKFAWQEGYGAFSVSPTHLPKLFAYIENQEAHHRERTFRAEYQQILEAYGIAYEDAHTFQEPI